MDNCIRAGFFMQFRSCFLKTKLFWVSEKTVSIVIYQVIFRITFDFNSKNPVRI